eukprot:s5959_g2.t2
MYDHADVAASIGWFLRKSYTSWPEMASAWQSASWATRRRIGEDGNVHTLDEFESGTCEPFECQTGPDEACRECTAPEDRTGENQCSACNPGYALTARSCEALTCVEGEGSLCAKCEVFEKRRVVDQCLTCNQGFKLSADSKCVPFSCSVGAEDKCRICTQPALRTADDQCYQCNPGYRLNMDMKCEPFPCDEGEGAKCKTCRELASRTAPHQCSTCNAGYGLVDALVCKPFLCSPGPNGGCKACKAQKAMTAFDQCAACNDGYFLTSEFTCQLGSENWASNSKVVRYAKQAMRELVNKLDRNSDGSIDKGELDESSINDAIQRGIAGLRGGIIQGQVDPVPAVVFGAADVDGDGALSRAEFEALEARESQRQSAR